MLLSTIFDQLRYGELAHLYMGTQVELGSLTGCNMDQLLVHIDLGLEELHKRFPLKMEEVIIKQYDNIQIYELHSRFAVTNTESTEPIKYIDDSIYQPFTDNVIKIEQIFDEDGQELYVNDSGQYWSMIIPSYNKIQIPWPEKENSLDVIYRASHARLLGVPDLDACSHEIDIPYSLMEALVYYVASRVYTNHNTDGINAGNTYMAKFEKSCQKVEELNIFNMDFRANYRLEENQWV